MIFKEKASLGVYSLVLSVYTVCAFHIPFFTYLRQHLEGGFNGVVLFATAVLLLLALNYVFYYLLVFLFRKVGKCILAFTLFGDAVMLYFVNTYNVFITDEMMGNAITTQYSEASGFFSWVCPVCAPAGLRSHAVCLWPESGLRRLEELCRTYGRGCRPPGAPHLREYEKLALD